MNRKGFTLIEVLAVIIILGLLTAIIVPVVNNLLGDSEDALYSKQVDSIVKASKKYAVEHSELLPDESDYTAIYVSDLISNGVIDKDKIINPKTKEQMNGCVVVNYNNEFNQYDYNYRDDCSITITFDPEGGSVSTTSKEVMIGKTYGELPEPTRDGYKFKGWRGKNMFDQETILMAIDGAEYIDGHYVFSVHQAHLKYKDGISALNFKEDTQYVMTINGYSIGNGETKPNFRIVFKYTDGTESYKTLNNISEENVVYTSYSGKTIEKIIMWYGNGGKVYISSIYLEERNDATSYEPYQEFSSDTVVNKGSDYTLHAIWEVAS